LASSNASNRKRKFRKTGRHSAPSAVGKVARRAGLAAPAVAVAGALAAVPQVRDLVVGESTTSGSHQVLSGDLYRDQVGAPLARSLTSYKSRLRGAATARPSRPAARHQAHASARPSAKASPSVTATASATPSASSPAAATSPAVSPTAPTGGSGGTTVQCSADAGGMLPENYAEIVSFLTAHGYTGLAAAGIAGNIYQESGGNPESVGSGGGGLIGWTPLPAGFVTGDVAADLQTQLEALLTFNNQWSQYIPVLNSATTAAQAADLYMTYFERPGIPAAGNREAAATAVAQACGL
jgi:hypothetical protein